MRKVLFINSAGNPKYDAAKHIRPFLREPYEIVNAEFEELPKNLACYSHVILGGSVAPSYESKWQNRLYKWLVTLVRTDIPILGICYGHQIIVGRYLGMRYLRKREKENIGWGKITVRTDDPLLGRKGDFWFPFAYHGYELFDLPEDTIEVIASSEKCYVMAYKFRNKNIWGFQPHFEIDRADAIELLERFKVEITNEIKNSQITHEFHRAIFDRFFAI